MNSKNIQFIFLCILCFILGFLSNKYILLQPLKKTIITENKTLIREKKEVVRQATSQKDSNLSQQTSYIEKSFNNKGILIHEKIFGNQMVASSKEITKIMLINKVNKNETSDLKSTIISSFQPVWHMGFSVYSQDFFQNSRFNFSDINLILTYRIFGNVELIGLTNYKLQSQIGIIFPF